MKLPILLLVLGTAAMTHADRLFAIPTAFIGERGTLQMDFFSSAGDRGLNRQRLELVATQNLEVSIAREAVPGSRARFGLDVYYNYVPPITERFPGISFGVLDVLNRTRAGRAPFLAFTYAVPMVDAAAWEKDFALHFGFGGGAFRGVFAGFEFPFTNNFTFWGEHDTRGINAGIQWWPSRGLSVRVFTSDGRAWWGIGLTRSFGRRATFPIEGDVAH